MIVNITDDELRLSEMHFRAAEAVIAALSPRSDRLTEQEKWTYESALQYIDVCLYDAPCLVDERAKAEAKAEAA